MAAFHGFQTQALNLRTNATACTKHRVQHEPRHLSGKAIYFALFCQAILGSFSKVWFDGNNIFIQEFFHLARLITLPTCPYLQPDASSLSGC